MRVVVIGGGPAGLEAAKAAAPHAAVTLVSAGPIGGLRRLALRVWLTAAADGERDRAAIVARVEQATAAWSDRCTHELVARDVDVVVGRGRLGAPGEVLVDEGSGGAPRRLPADAVIVTSGVPLPALAGLATDGARIITDAQLATLKARPERVFVLGDGPTGVELCHTLSLLGSAVTWFVPEVTASNRIAPEVDAYLTHLLEQQGVLIVPRARGLELAVTEGGVQATTARDERYDADVAVLPFERRPDPEHIGLNVLEAVTDIYGQTRRRGVYLVGDALAPRGESVAMAQGRAAALHAVRRSSAPADIHHIVRSFMHAPQVARVGQLTTDGAHDGVTVALVECAAAYVGATTEGFFTLAWDQSGRVVGALAVAPGAAAILAPVAIAMRTGLRLDDLAAAYGPHDSTSELLSMAARKAERLS